MTKKDYDTTLARMAGNIAAGYIATDITDFRGHYDFRQIAEDSVELAEQIIDRLRDLNGSKSKPEA